MKLINPEIELLIMEEIIESIIERKISFKTKTPINVVSNLMDKLSKYGTLNEVKPMKVFASQHGEIIEGAFEVTRDFDSVSRAEVVIDYTSSEEKLTLEIRCFYKTIFKDAPELFREYYLKELRSPHLKETKRLAEKVMEEIKSIEKSRIKRVLLRG